MEIEAGREVLEDEPQVRRGGNLPDLVEDRRNRIGAQGFRVARKLFPPKAQRFGIAHAVDDALSEAIIGVEACEIDQVACSRETSAAAP